MAWNLTHLKGRWQVVAGRLEGAPRSHLLVFALLCSPLQRGVGRAVGVFLRHGYGGGGERVRESVAFCSPPCSEAPLCIAGIGAASGRGEVGSLLEMSVWQGLWAASRS